ncbi:MAG: nucleoside-diphosphate kinase [Myxococcota bacterium]
MAQQKTLSIIKPDGVQRNLIGPILTRFEQEGLCVVGAHMKHLSRHEAQGFYAVHRNKPFFDELVDYMCSGFVLLLVLQGEDAVARNRQIMGATNPADAAEGTLRQLYGKSLQENTVHGSDSEQTAAQEIAWFFSANMLRCN